MTHLVRYLWPVDMNTFINMNKDILIPDQQVTWNTESGESANINTPRGILIGRYEKFSF